MRDIESGRSPPSDPIFRLFAMSTLHPLLTSATPLRWTLCVGSLY